MAAMFLPDEQDTAGKPTETAEASSYLKHTRLHA